MEIAFPSTTEPCHVRLSFWQDGLPIQAIPPQDYLKISGVRDSNSMTCGLNPCSANAPVFQPRQAS
jgi:hypothetical protein